MGFLIPGSRVRISAGVLKSTGFPVLFSFQARGSFVAPASILKNPQICTGSEGLAAGLARCSARGASRHFHDPWQGLAARRMEAPPGPRGIGPPERNHRRRAAGKLRSFKP